MKTLVKTSSFSLIVVTAICLSAHAQQAPGNRPSSQFSPSGQADTVIRAVTDEKGLPLVLPGQLQPGGTFWTFLPADGSDISPPFPGLLDTKLPVYEIANGQFLVDGSSRSQTGSTPNQNGRLAVRRSTAESVISQATALVSLVDWIQGFAANQQFQILASAAGINLPDFGDPGGGGGVFTNTFSNYTFDKTSLWIQVPTNSLDTPDFFTVNVMNTIQDQSYDILTTSDLHASWATELVVTGAVGNITQVQIPMNGRTNLFVRARTSVSLSFYLILLPLSQDVSAGDTVTFRAETGGNTNLTFQWTYNGCAIAGATNSSYSINRVQAGDTGNYAVIISDGTNAAITRAAILTVESGTGDAFYMHIFSQRQDYTFKSGVTYYFDTLIELYGKTTIEGGAVIKPDWYTDAGLIVLGTLDCKTEPYLPAIFTSVDDDSVGEYLGFSQDDGPPLAIKTGIPYLDLTSAKSSAISNLRMAYADWGVSTPTNFSRLDVWDCQFVQCNYGVVNFVNGQSTNSFHNVLLASCGAAVGAATNTIAIEGEQVTAYVSDLYLAYLTAGRIALTNSIIWGNAISASALATVNVAMNPDATNFLSADGGNYYLTANSPLHKAGTTSISPRLQSELRGKTTYAPVAIAPLTQITGQLTLAPQVPRYTNDAPDIGYYYDALDYTIAALLVFGGNVAILPGTAIGLDNGLVTTPTHYYWTFDVFLLNQGGTVISHGLPGKPNLFVAANLVQEEPNLDFGVYKREASRELEVWPPSLMSFNTDCKQGDAIAPNLDFRFSRFILQGRDLHFGAGLDMNDELLFSTSSAVNMRLQDCQLQGGQISLGPLDKYGLPMDLQFAGGALMWCNNTFDNVGIYLNPTYYWTNQVVNCDMQLQAYNNLFRKSMWLILESFPTSAGSWVFKDNLFEEVRFIQDTNQSLDFDNNGYWPLQISKFYAGRYASQLLPAIGDTLSGAHDKVLPTAPQYQGGPFGNFYFSAVTPLWQAGSRTAGDAGLSQYTTLITQIKDAADQPVNIGPHYVATSNTVPLDTDCDGVPDFVEVEHGTDPNKAHTVDDILDLTNSVYDNVDLDGDGLTGKAERLLGTNPLTADNPLDLPAQQGILSGQILIPLSISSNVDANASLILLVDGLNSGAQIQKCTNGWFASWDSTTTENGPHFLDIQYVYGDSTDETSDEVIGGSASANLFNPLTFSEGTRDFTDLLVIDAAVNNGASSYQIDVFDAETRTYLTNLSGDVNNGLIATNWNLRDAQGIQIATNGIRCDFYLYNDAQQSMTATPNGLSFPIGPIPIPYRMIDHIEGRQNFTVAWGFLEYDDNNRSSAMNTAMLNGVINKLNTLFDWYGDGTDYNLLPSIEAGANANVPYAKVFRWNYSSDHADRQTLFQSLSSGANFYWWGHGKPTQFSPGEFSPGVDYPIYATELATNLNNINGIHAHHPYNLVILDCCYGYSRDLANAFGMSFNSKGYNYSKQQYAEWERQPQGFVGWTCRTPAPKSKEEIQFMQQCQNLLFTRWQQGYSLINCVQAYVNELEKNPTRFPKSILDNWKLSGCYDLQTYDR